MELRLFCAVVAAEVLIGIFRKWQIHFKDIDKFTKLCSLTVPVQIILGTVSMVVFGQNKSKGLSS